MIMPILVHIRKKKMGIRHIVFTLIITCFHIVNSDARAVSLKTMNVAMPTNYGTFLGEIHYNEKDLVQALKVERIIKEDLIKVINYFEYVPHDVVHFNIDPYMRLTNGNARTFPTNIINLYNFPANNHEHLIVMDNWMQGLVFHEFIHIAHLDQTRDFLKLGRQIFGTIAKLPTSIVPRWFTEGIAVWGESHLLTGGRLSNPLFNKELLIQFQNPEFCKTIDCISNPGVYPQGSLAYWAGSHFIEYLENEKPKTIKCLVEENSQNIPFFLNSAFRRCVGETAEVMFKRFRADYIAKATPANGEWGARIKNVFGSTNYQAGFVLDGDRLFKMEEKKFKQALVAYDLKDDVTFSGKFSQPISDIVSMVDIDNENRMLLVSFNDDPNYREQNKVWKLINPDTLLIERTLLFAHDPSYVVPLGGESFITFSYWNNQWLAERNGDLLRAFSGNDNITLVKKVGERILLKINDSYGVTSLVLTDYKLKTLSVLYKTNANFDVPVINDKFSIVRQEDSLKLIDFEKTFEISELPKDLLAGVTFAEFNDNRVIALSDDLKSEAKSQKDSENFFKKDKSKSVKIETSEFKELAAPTGSYASAESEKYPRLDHLIPHYWFLASGSSDNSSSIGAMTTFVDPMDVYTLDATALVYPSEKKLGGTLDYVQKLVNVSDLWYVTGYFNQDYSKSDFSSHLNLSRDLTAKTFYTLLARQWTYAPGVFVGKSTTDDFISHRSVSNVGFSQALIYQTLSYDDFVQYFKGNLNLQGNKADIGNSFFVLQMATDFGVRFSDQFTASFKGSFGHLYKSDFIRGVIYGGGDSDYAKKRTYEFYGLPYSNAFGNKVYTTRLMGDYQAYDLYRGINLVPFFFKELHFLFGFQSLYADRIILESKVIRNQSITGIFVGPRFKLDIFYLVPADIDVIFSSINNPNGKNVNQVDFTISASLFN